MAPATTQLCQLWFPNLQSISASFSGYAGRIDVGIGKQGDTEVVPASIAVYVCNTNNRFYVPDALVEDYKSATNWSTVADKILPLSESGISAWNGGVFDA